MCAQKQLRSQKGLVFYPDMGGGCRGRGLKGQKMAQNDQKFCRMIVLLVHMCKMMISPGIFHFKILTFCVKGGMGWVKVQKMT